MNINRRSRFDTSEQSTFVLLVTGGREFNDRKMLDFVLDKALHRFGVTHLLHGGARGLDTMAHNWAVRNGVQTVRCDANWDHYKKAAGVIRNKMMALLNPDIMIAFPGGTGTANMVELAAHHGIKTYSAKRLYQNLNET